MLFLLALLVATPSPLDGPARVTTQLRPLVRRAGSPTSLFTLAQRLAHHRVPGLGVAVADGGQIVWAQGFGRAAADRPSLVSPGTLFQAGSISKPVAATATLYLVGKGELSLDGDVNQQLRSWKVPENQFTAQDKVTLRRILSHTAGLTVPSFAGFRSGQALPTLLDLLEGRSPANTDPVRVQARPGSVCRYSGGGTLVEQLILTEVTGRSFPTLMKEMVFDPLGMSSSSFQQPLPTHLGARAAAAHDAGGTTLPGRSLIYPQLAAAGLWTTPGDLLRWAMAISAARAGHPGALLPPALASEMLTRQAGSVVGLGPFIRGSGRTLQFGHQGWNQGFQSRVTYFPETGQGAAVMANGPGGRALVREVLAAIAEAYDWPELESPETVTAVVLPGTTLNQLVGSYAGGKPIRVQARLTRQGSRLRLAAPELGPPTEVLLTGPAEFITADGGDRFAITRNADGEVTGLSWGDLVLARQPAQRERTSGRAWVE